MTPPATVRPPECGDTQGRRDLIEAAGGNGIDFVEVDALDHTKVSVRFLADTPANAWGLPANPDRVAIEGGVRVTGIRVLSAVRTDNRTVLLTTDRGGDHSTYLLTITGAGLDPLLAQAPVNFMAACPSDLDCETERVCEPEPLDEPAIDYLARDFAGFNRMLAELTAQRHPGFTEQNPADLAVTLRELIAYEGDQLSYMQDAVDAERFFDTARWRISYRRHARLVDYRVHEGRNSWTYLHLAVTGPARTLPLGMPAVTRLAAVPTGQTGPLGPVLDADRLDIDAVERDPAYRGAAVFETTHDVLLDPSRNEIAVHSFGNDDCCLGPGSTDAYLYWVDATLRARRPVLAPGELLLFEEVRSPETGLPADADPDRRQVVVVAEVADTNDLLFSNQLVADPSGGPPRLQPRAPGQPSLPLLHVRWHRSDALRHPFCLTTAPAPGLPVLRGISVARGNVVRADHGLSVVEPVALPDPRLGAARMTLQRAPLTHQRRPDRMVAQQVAAAGAVPEHARLVTPRTDLAGGADAARPAITLLERTPLGDRNVWQAVPDLLDSPPGAQEFVAEVDDAGRPRLRFPSDTAFEAGTEIAARYRVGNGRAGNIGRDAVGHVALSPAGGPTGWLVAVRNPLPAVDGTDPEAVEEVRHAAPAAFSARLGRAVTEADYVAALKLMPGVAGAVAQFRWTGSWHTVFVSVDPVEPEALVNRDGGRTELEPSFGRAVLAWLHRFRLAGVDLELRPPRFIAAEIGVHVCAAAGHFRTDVKEAVLDELSNRRRRRRGAGFFHPDNFGFGQPLYLSRLYEAVDAVPGVDSAEVEVFKRYGEPEAGELAAGVLAAAPWEIVRCDNDPNFPEHGVLRVVVDGGKG